MFTRIFWTVGLIAGSLLGADLASDPSNGPQGLSGQAQSQPESHKACSIKNGERPPAQAAEHSENSPLFAQLVWASSCYTFAGPVCPLLNLTPVGAACYCTSPIGPLPGIAQQ